MPSEVEESSEQPRKTHLHRGCSTDTLTALGID